MPQGENFWNPYRWVTVSNNPVEHDVPNYHHTLSGLSGRLWCELEALTPLVIGNGRGQFVHHRGSRQPYIPATSLKGPIRSLAEVVGNATVPFPGAQVDNSHRLENARSNINDVAHFDTVARTFGYLSEEGVVAGLIHFSDAEISYTAGPPNNWSQRNVTVGQPNPKHKAFYPGDNRRKFYHHHPGAVNLITGTMQPRPVTPAPPETCFEFTVDFTNLRDTELNLLLYCLVLEEDVPVTLSPAALGTDDAQEPFIFTGPLRHKIGGAKPHGAGSVHIRVTKMELSTDAAARYRGQNSSQMFAGQNLITELRNRTASFRGRTDVTMQELRAMLIYSTDDPRTPIRYPRYDWFQNEREKEFHLQTRLKPTI